MAHVGMNCVVTVIVVVVGCGCALADVYKWTDANGDVHYGDFTTQTNAEKLITQQQIQQEENAGKAARKTKPQPRLPDDNLRILQEAQHRHDECQHYLYRRADILMNSPTPVPYSRLGRRYGYQYNQQNNNVDFMKLIDIQAGIRKYCLED